MSHDSPEAQRMRTQMGQSVAALMDITDAEMAGAIHTANAVLRDLNTTLRARGVPIARRLSLLTGAVFAAIADDLPA